MSCYRTTCCHVFLSCRKPHSDRYNIYLLGDSEVGSCVGQSGHDNGGHVTTGQLAQVRGICVGGHVTSGQVHSVGNEVVGQVGQVRGGGQVWQVGGGGVVGQVGQVRGGGQV